jgi:hypothetical protein
MSHTYVVLEISDVAFREIAEKLHKAQYYDAFDGDVIDMHGIAIKSEGPVEKKSVLRVTSEMTADGTFND